MKNKKELTPDQVYKRNQRVSKWLGWLSPFVFWFLIAGAGVLLVFALKNSFGNIGEITSLLDSNTYTGDELRDNYAYLLEKYGEWHIGNGGAGFSISFVDIAHACFSGIMITECVLSAVCLVGAFVLGKWFLPRLSKQLADNNQDMVNLTILKQQNKE